MTKLQMLEYVYSILSSFYGVPMNAGYKVKRLDKQAIERIYNVALLNAKFGDSITEQAKLIESHISWENELFTSYM